MKYDIWNISEQEPDTVLSVARECGISVFLARLLYNRNIKSPAEARIFLSPSLSGLGDPFSLPDMDKAVARIKAAIDAHSNITVYGDYDVDGITSTTILYLYLKKLGASVDYYVPDRFSEGYGMNSDAIRALKNKGTDLIITVDNGITAIEETELIHSLGMDIVITDHHQCRSELPKAEAVVNPKRHDSTYPFSEYAGVGVAFKLLCALEANINGLSHSEASEKIISAYGDFAAIGTIADVMPLFDENRILVKKGLLGISESHNIGLHALIDLIENGDNSASAQGKREARDVTSSFVGYTLSPRINAAGRIGDAAKAIKLFTTENPDEASALALELLEYNHKRQAIEAQIYKEALQCIKDDPSFENDKIIVLTSDHWHHGIIGIVASKLCERTRKPTILISFDGCDDIGKGSGRSVSGFNLVDALEHTKDLLYKYGGHEQAAGLSVLGDNVAAFRKMINAYAEDVLSKTEIKSEISVDFELGLSDVTIKNISDISKLEPFGSKNPSPSFLFRNMYVKSVSGVGMNKHLRLALSSGRITVTAMYFGISPDEFPFKAGSMIDVIAQPEINRYKGYDNVQLNVTDARKAQERVSSIFERIEALKKKGSAFFTCDELPIRSDFAFVYRSVMQLAKAGVACFDASEVLGTRHDGVSFEKFAVILEVLCEMGVWSYNITHDGRFMINKINSDIKIDLANSEILNRVIQNLN